MPWKESTAMSQRLEFVTLARSTGANIRRLCRRYGISPKTGYKWLHRYAEGGEAALWDRCRRPHTSPSRTSRLVEEAVLRIRDAHPAWGGRKIRARLEGEEWSHLPSPSTITAILQRRGRMNPDEFGKHQPWRRFEAEAPNDLWQMDFKGHFPLQQGRCHPLTVLDDHSRFSLGVRACGDEKGTTVQTQLTTIFRRYGLPRQILVDNGSPWGSDTPHPYTPLTAWLMRLPIMVIHSRPHHPQTLGKDERFHRTLIAEVIALRLFHDLEESQRHFEAWRHVYNFERPHEALGMAAPASRYRESPREFPEALPPIEYGPGDQVRKVQAQGIIHFRGQVFRVGKAFRGHPVALRPTQTDGVWNVFFCHQKVAQIDLSRHTVDP
jgi:transposase InsO family protein